MDNNNDPSMLDDIYNEIMKRYNAKNTLLQFLPSSQSVISNSIGYTGKDPNSDNPLVKMKLINNNFHTPESCKLTAALKFSDIKNYEKKRLTNGSIRKTPGLSYKIVNGYFKDDVKYFLKANQISSGISTDFSTLQKATNNSTQGNQIFSVEWYGVIIPDSTGLWKFSLNSDDASYLWIGNKAVHLYSNDNADINNGGLHDMTVKDKILLLSAGNTYPIRIQFGGGSIRNISLSISSPNNPNSNNYYNILFSLSEEPKLMYYSLVQTNKDLAKTNLYNCYITDPNDSNMNNQLNTVQVFSNDDNDNGLEVAEIWHLIEDYSKLPADGMTYLQFAVKEQHAQQQQLNLYSPDGRIITTLYDTNVQTPNDGLTYYPDKHYFYLELKSNDKNVSLQIIQFGDDWRPNIVKILFSGSFENAIQNPTWMKEKAESKSKPHSSMGVHYMAGYWDDHWNYQIRPKETFLISDDGKFKLQINSKGNLVLTYTKNSNQLKTNDDEIYTNDSNRFLYDLTVDEKINKTYYLDDISHNLLYVPYNSNILQPNGNYLSLGNSFPTGINEKIVPNPTGEKGYCEKICNNEEICQYFFHSKVNNNAFCVLGVNNTENIFPGNHAGINFNNIDDINLKFPGLKGDAKFQINSNLYVKDKVIKMSPDLQNKPIPNTTVEKADDYTKYQYYSLSDRVLITPQKIGVLNSDEYKNWDATQYKLLFGSNTSSNNVEPFNNYDTADCSLDQNGCISNIENKKINPLIEISADYSKKINSISQNNTNINTKIQTYQQSLADISNNPIYNFNSTELNKKTLLDGMQDDVNEMLLQENTMYIAGAITTLTLMITGIMISFS